LRVNGPHWRRILLNPTEYPSVRAPAACSCYTPDNARLLAFLAAASHQMDFAVGCYCADENHCHRSILRELLRENGASLR